ncbi:hypothetical protein [Actinotalea soli]|nr:hypothetical protein [Actinotalea soli]
MGRGGRGRSGHRAGALAHLLGWFVLAVGGGFAVLILVSVLLG